MAANIYYEKDVDRSAIADKKVAILGYGSQGHAHALNLKESGIDVRVGLREGSGSVAKAEAAGLAVRSIADATAEADIVMNNFRPGVSSRLSVGPEQLSKLNPSLIVMEAPAFGKEGPLAMKAGFDMVMQAWVGHEAKAAGEGNKPRWNRTNLVDIAAGMIGTVAMLAALFHRERTGECVSLESPLCNAGIYTLAELIQRPDGEFAGVPTLSSSLRGFHPAEALYAASDGWVAIVARGDSAALALRDKLGGDKG